MISLAPYDHARRHRSLPDWCRALADLALAEDRRHGHALGGVATVRVEQDPRLPPGTFRVSRDGGPAEAPGLVATPGEPGESPDGRPRLVLPFGGHVLPSHGDAGRQVLLTPGRTTVGRGPESAIRLGDVSVSLVHAHVDVEPDGTTRLSDAGSVNGLRVDGVRVRQAELVDGNRIELGSAALVYRRDPVDDDGGRQGGVGGDRG